MANVKFNKGLLASLPAQSVEGALYFTTDEAIYLGLANGAYHRFGDFIEVANVAALPEKAHAKALYYAKDENVLCKYDGTEWVQINLNTTYTIAAGATAGSVKLVGSDGSSVEVQVVDVAGLNSAISAADAKGAQGIADAATAQAKGEEALAAANKAQGDVNALSDKVGVITEGKTVGGEIADLKATVGALTGGEEGAGSIGESIDAKINALDVEDAEVAGQFVVAVPETDGKVAPARRALKASDIPTIEQTQVSGLTDSIADAKKAGTDANAALEAYKTTNDAAVIEAKKAGTDAQAYAEGVNTAFGEYKTANDKALADEIARAKAAEEANKGLAEKAQSDVDALAGKVGTVPEDKTVVQMIADAQSAATYDDTKVKEDIQANADAIAEEKARMDAFMALGEGETLNAALDSLKELQDYITNEAADADIIVGKVAALEAIVDGIGGEGEEATVVAYVTKAIEALKIGDYAKAADLSAAVERIAANEQAIAGLGTLAQKSIVTETEVDEALMAKINASAEGNHSHSNKTVLDGITAEKVSAWDSAEANAIAKANELNGAMDTRVQAVEGKAHEHANKAVLDGITESKVADWDDAVAKEHEHANKALLDTYDQTNADLKDAVAKKHVHANATVLDGISADKVSAWDAAEQNAKDYADGLAGNYDAAGSAATAEGNAKAYADSLIEWSEF